MSSPQFDVYIQSLSALYHGRRGVQVHMHQSHAAKLQNLDLKVWLATWQYDGLNSMFPYDIVQL